LIHFYKRFRTKIAVVPVIVKTCQRKNLSNIFYANLSILSDK